MIKALLVVLAAALVFAAGVLASPSGVHRMKPVATMCSSGYVDGVIGGEPKCLHAREYCSAASESDYERYGFSCRGGRLQSAAPAPVATTTDAWTPPVSTLSGSTLTTTAVVPTISTPTGSVADPGPAVLLKKQTKFSGCKIGPLPDRRCSPGAYASRLTKAVICSASFRTGPVRNVSEATKHQIEREYGLPAKSYGHTLEIDHIISLEVGGSNDPANLYPEELTLANHQPGYRIKDKVETKAAKAVCAGRITLFYAQHQIAANWELLYKRLYGVMPTG